MSWAKIDDRANEHPKLLEAGAKAAWLWACGLMWANRQAKKTGRIPKPAVSMLFAGLGLREAKRLVEVGLWLDDGKSYLIHDYACWNPEAKQGLSETRSEAGRRGGKRSGEARRQAKTKQVASDDGSKTEAQGKQPSRTRVTRVDPPPPPPPEENPLTPFADRPPDPFMATLVGQVAHQRTDVNELHEAYKRTFDLPHRSWFARNFHEAETLAVAIDAHGLAQCLLVVTEAPNDGMVSGREDENKRKHESIEYIFGNSAAFDRILRAATERAKRTGNGRPIADKMAELKNRRVS